MSSCGLSIGTAKFIMLHVQGGALTGMDWSDLLPWHENTSWLWYGWIRLNSLIFTCIFTTENTFRNLKWYYSNVKESLSFCPTFCTFTVHSDIHHFKCKFSKQSDATHKQFNKAKLKASVLKTAVHISLITRLLT